MKFTLILLAGFIGFAVAQTTSSSAHSPTQSANIPACVLKCSNEAAQTAGCTTDIEDPACICKNPGFLSAAEPCVQTNCSAADHQAAMALYKSICGPLASQSGSAVTTTSVPTTGVATSSSLSLGTSPTAVATSAAPSSSNSSNAAIAGFDLNTKAFAIWSAMLVGGAVVAQAIL